MLARACLWRYINSYFWDNHQISLEIRGWVLLKLKSYYCFGYHQPFSIPDSKVVGGGGLEPPGVFF